MNITDLRQALGLSLAEFAKELGLASRGQVSLIERGAPCSVRVALKIEALSDGRIDAASLNGDVRDSRAAVHAPMSAAVQHPPSPDGAAENIGAVA